MREADKIKEPKPEDFSQAAVSRAVFSEAIQHPTTLFPAAAGILGTLYMLLINFDKLPFAVAVGGGIAGIASYVYHYFVRGEKLGAEYVNTLKAKRVRSKERQAVNMEEECRKAGFMDGEKESRELKESFTRLHSFLKDKVEKKRVMTAERFMLLAEQNYNQGIHLLQKALVLFNVLKEIDNVQLEEEKAAFQRALNEMARREDDSQKPVMEALYSKIKSHDKRLEKYEERKEGLQLLMAQLEELEAALDTAYLEMADLVDDETFGKRTDVASNLEKAVDQARRVEERLRGKHDEKPDDDIYAKAGREAKE